MYSQFLKHLSSQSTAHYSPLSNETKTEHKRSSTNLGKRTFLLRLRFVCLVLWNALLASFAVYGIYVRFNGTPPRPVSCYCGTSFAEARKLGCKFDSLSVSWLPEKCRDDELTAEFESSGPGPNGEWPFWADINATQPMTVEEVSLLAGNPPSRAKFYTSYGWHVAHCVFSWRKEFRQRAKGLMYEKRHDKESHIEHCYAWLKQRWPLNSTGTVGFVSLGGDGFPAEEDHSHDDHHPTAHTHDQ